VEPEVPIEPEDVVPLAVVVEPLEVELERDGVEPPVDEVPVDEGPEDPPVVDVIVLAPVLDSVPEELVVD
jgi:hypothetical protein